MVCWGKGSSCQRTYRKVSCSRACKEDRYAACGIGSATLGIDGSVREIGFQHDLFECMCVHGVELLANSHCVILSPCLVDKDGMIVSLIQSNYNGYGTGLVAPGCRIFKYKTENNFCMNIFLCRSRIFIAKPRLRVRLQGWGGECIGVVCDT